ncbi:hypothetical protein l11_06440 [Neisseria weaveri LMG 5135]|nr:hypothetical protein l11_06440 [Neisseria weaveri LMG 5135]
MKLKGRLKFSDGLFNVHFECVLYLWFSTFKHINGKSILNISPVGARFGCPADVF